LFDYIKLADLIKYTIFLFTFFLQLVKFIEKGGYMEDIKFYKTENRGEDILFIGGLGNRYSGDNIKWFVNRLRENSFRVHFAELKTDIRDFKKEYIDPVNKYAEALGDFLLIGHSLGGLVANFVKGARRVVYLSPWWGIYGEKLRTKAINMLPLLKHIKLRIQHIDYVREEVGKLVTDKDWGYIPTFVSFPFVSEVVTYQKKISVKGDYFVFTSLRDTIISLKAIGENANLNRIILFNGEHEFFSSDSREETFKELLKYLR